MSVRVRGRTKTKKPRKKSKTKKTTSSKSKGFKGELRSANASLKRAAAALPETEVSKFNRVAKMTQTIQRMLS